jgi:hypothetical protein
MLDAVAVHDAAGRKLPAFGLSEVVQFPDGPCPIGLCVRSHAGLLDEAGENGRRFHRVGVALLAVAAILIRLHLAREVAVFVHANGGGDGIGEHRLHQRLDAVVAFDLNELGELCVVTRIAHVLLLATGARGFGRQSARGRPGWIVTGERKWPALGRCGIMRSMTKLLEQAIEKVRKLPEADQDTVAVAVLSMAEEQPVALDPDTRAAIREGLEQARRGEFVPDQEIDELWKRHGL